jgi:hypothetical protein
MARRRKLPQVPEQLCFGYDETVMRQRDWRCIFAPENDAPGNLMKTGAMTRGEEIPGSEDVAQEALCLRAEEDRGEMWAACRLMMDRETGVSEQAGTADRGYALTDDADVHRDAEVFRDVGYMRHFWFGRRD